MARTRQMQIVDQIMKPGNCVLILDGKEFGTLLGELLKMLTVAEEGQERAEQELERVRVELDARTPDGLKDELRAKLSASAFNDEERAIGLHKEKE